MSISKRYVLGAVVVATSAVLVTAGTTAVASASSSAPSRDAAAGPSSPAAATQVRMWLAGTPSDSFETRVLRFANTPTRTQTAETVLAQLLRTAQRGKNVNTGPASPAAQVSQLQGLKSRLTSAIRPRLQAPMTVEVPASNPSGVRGGPINSNRSWRFPMELVGGYCDFNCVNTDIIRQTWTIDPGRTADRFSFTSTYTYDPVFGPQFVDIYAGLAAYCGATSGNQCALEYYPPGGPRNGIGSGTTTLSHPNDAGHHHYDRVQLIADFVPAARNYYDNAATGLALCGTGSNVNCIY